MSDIFISYASEDRPEAEQLAHALESQRWSVWWDRSIPVGKSFATVIQEELNEAKCVAVIWSKNSVKSQWVHAEIKDAQENGTLFPLNIDGSKLPLPYNTMHTADFSSWSGDVKATVFQQLTTAIKGQIGAPASNEGNVSTESATAPPDERSTSGQKKSTKPKWIAPVSVVLLL